MVVVLLAHQVASAYHVYVGPLPTVSTDSSGFNFFARNYGVTGGGRLDYMLYIHLLGGTYQTFGYSQYLGCQLSQLSFSLTLIIFLECCKLFELNNTKVSWGVCVFGLLPSCILTTAVTMREAFQMTGFLLFVYGLLRIRVHGIDSGLVLLPVGTLWLLFFHKGFALFLLFALPCGFFWANGSRPDRLIAASALAFVVLFLFGDTLWRLMLEQSSSLQRIVEGEGLDYIDNYADQVMEGRTEFDVNLQLNSLSGFLTTGPIVYIYYLFSPLPWQVRGLLDIVGVAESLVRMVLVYHSLRGFSRAKGDSRRTQGFLLVIFFFMEMTWAAGTANWGTAIRHRLVAWPLLVLLGLRGSELNLMDETEPGESSGGLSRRQQVREIRRKKARPSGELST